MAYFFPQSLLRPLQDVYLALAVQSKGTITPSTLREALRGAGLGLGEEVDLEGVFQSVDFKSAGEE